MTTKEFQARRRAKRTENKLKEAQKMMAAVEARQPELELAARKLNARIDELNEKAKGSRAL